MDIGRILLGVAGLALAANGISRSVGHLKEGFRSPAARSGSMGNTTMGRPSPGLPPAMTNGVRKQTVAGPIKVTRKTVRNLDDRMAQIISHANEGKFDPNVIAWTRKELSKKCRNGWNGEQWCVPEKDTRAEVLAIFRALRRDVRYTSDISGADTYMHPRVTLRLGTGDCDDFSSLGCAALQSAGIPCRFKVIRTRDSNSWNHIYIQGGFPKDDPKQWISLDASVPMPPGWEAPSNMVAEARVFETF